jgi:hypothetical protein
MATFLELEVTYDPHDIDRRWYAEVWADDGRKRTRVYQSPRLLNSEEEAYQDGRDWMRLQAEKRREERERGRRSACLCKCSGQG